MSDKSLKDKAIDIKGKKYVLVSDRVLYFNENYPNGSIATSFQLEGDTYMFRAEVTPDVKVVSRTFVGHSQATIGDGMVNKTAAMENAETSAVGRALAMMGIGVLESIASADEMNKATGSQGISNKYATDKQIKWVRDTAARVYGLDNQEEIDKAIESVLTVPVDKIPIKAVKRAVDTIEADKSKTAPVRVDSIVIDKEMEEAIDNGTFLDDIPY